MSPTVAPEQKVVRNDHVLAIVKLREEELEREEQAEQQQRLMADRQQQASADEAVENHLPKLTRAKAKELNQVPLPLVPVTPVQPNDEVAALIHEELHSDDDDEEYQPAEDEFEVSGDERRVTDVAQMMTFVSIILAER